MLTPIANLIARIPAIRRAVTYAKLVRAGLIGDATAAGVGVTPESALTCSPVFSATRVISTAVGTLPLCVFRKEADGSRVRATSHPTYRLLHDAPNEECTPVAFWSAFVVQMLLHGAGVAEIERDEASGEPLALWLLPANRVKPRRDAAGQLYYEVQAGKDGPTPLLPEYCFYVPYFSLCGTVGKGVIEFARESIGLAKAMETGAVAFFRNMIRPSGAIEAPPGTSETAIENIRKSIEKANAGPVNVGRLMLLEAGVKFNPWTVSNQDAQWLEGRQFGIQEAARFFNISPTKLADLGRATWSNIESENLSFIENTLRPILVGIEQEATKKLLSKADRDRMYVEALIEARLRGLTRDRYAAYETGIRAGFLLPSEARQMENLPAVPGIDDRPRPGLGTPAAPAADLAAPDTQVNEDANAAPAA